MALLSLIIFEVCNMEYSIDNLVNVEKSNFKKLNYIEKGK